MNLNSVRRNVPQGGTVLLTALFLVVVMFGLISATVLKVRYIQGMTKDQTQKAQAIYLAKAGLNLGLAKLNNGEPIPSGSTLSLSLDNGTVELSIEPQPAPNNTLIHLVSSARTSKFTHTARVVMRVEEGDFEGAVFARGGRSGSPFVTGDKADALYLKKGGGATWESLEPPDRVRYTADAAATGGFTVDVDSSEYPENFQKLEATENGLLFGVYKRNAGELDTIYKYNLKEDTWSHLPPTPTYDFNSDGSLGSARSLEFSRNTGSMASNGKDGLFVKGKSHDGAYDVIYSYDTSGDTWNEPLPRPSHFTFDANGDVSGTSGLAQDLKQVSVDGSGNVFTIHDRSNGGPVTDGAILKFDGATWAAVKPPDKVVYAPDSYIPVKVPGYADHITDLAVNQAGELFAVGKNTGGAPDTVYHYSNNAWTVIAPPSQTDFHKVGADFLDDHPPNDFSEITVDSEGKLYLREERSDSKFDSVYVYSEGEFSYLPQPTAEFYMSGSLVPDDNKASMGYLMNDINDITGGSHPTTGPKRYVPTAEF